MPIREKVHISVYLSIFQMTAAAAASQELSTSGKTPGASRAGTKYPVQGNPSLRRFLSIFWIFDDFRRVSFRIIVLYMGIEPGWWRNCPGCIQKSFWFWEWSQKLHFEGQHLSFLDFGNFQSSVFTFGGLIYDSLSPTWSARTAYGAAGVSGWRRRRRRPKN